ncbi:MAG: phosphoenolpyruvate synthase [Candidatus Parvarchaeota archaeon]
MSNKDEALVLWFREINREDTPIVGGKSANLGEMFNSVKVPIPNGFSTTALAFRKFISKNDLKRLIDDTLKGLDIENTKKLAEAGKKLRDSIMKAELQKDLSDEILEHYHQLVKETGEEFVAVRSSGTAEDLPDASFAGQQETYLNVHGDKELLEKVKECYASLFTDRAIYYRVKMNIPTSSVALAVAVQRQVFSKAAGVMFTIDVSTGDDSVVMIESSYGLGEYIVQGTVTPDTFYINKKDLAITKRIISPNKDKMLLRLKEGGTKEFKVEKDRVNKPSLTDEQIKKLASYGLEIEKHYSHAMDIEWAMDERKDELFIVQARFETVWDKKEKPANVSISTNANILIRGLPASPGLVSGTVQRILDVKDIEKFNRGNILVTKMTAPDWVPAMQKAKAIITDEGGMTCHAAIVSRELGVPSIVGTQSFGKKATEVLKDGEEITIDAKNGVIYEGILKQEQPEAEEKIPVEAAPEIITGTKIMVNLGEPELAEKTAKLPVDGVGLMREEFIWSQIGEHPLYMIKNGRQDELVNTLAENIGKVCSAFSPRPVILRFSDFKSDEYANLKGGAEFEPKEDNPLLGWRGSSRYYDPRYKDAFVLELKAVKKVREEMRLKNLWVMIPFTRTVEELEKVLEIMRENGLERGEDFKVFLMAEIPSNILLADKFNKLIDGYSIGSNDLTMLILGADRNNSEMSARFDERDLAVKRAIKMLIDTAHRDGKTVSICGQAPSEYDEIVDFLVRADIDDISVNPDVALHVREVVASVEKRVELESALNIKRRYDETDYRHGN